MKYSRRRAFLVSFPSCSLLVTWLYIWLLGSHYDTAPELFRTADEFMATLPYWLLWVFLQCSAAIFLFERMRFAKPGWWGRTFELSSLLLILNVAPFCLILYSAFALPAAVAARVFLIGAVEVLVLSGILARLLRNRMTEYLSLS